MMIQQNQPPILCYEIWEMEDGIHGSIIDWKPHWLAAKDYPYRYEIKGRTVVFVLLSHEGQITREDGIKFATAVATNRTRRISVDLEPCQPNRKK
jgi:hypothetical protein